MARVYEENQENIRTDSPTCIKESLRIMFVLSLGNGWKVSSIDIKAAFLQEMFSSTCVEDNNTRNTSKFYPKVKSTILKKAINDKTDSIDTRCKVIP